MVITILSALLSGLIGVLIGTWLNRYYETRRDKLKILEVLITYRWLPANQERVMALNRIPVVFYKNVSVCDAFEQYKKAQEALRDNVNNLEVFPQKVSALDDSYVKIIENIAGILKLGTSISWDKVKNPYIPRYYIDSNGQYIWY